MANNDVKKTLYNGKYELVFKNSSHRYYVNGSAKQGVTTAMGKVLAKPGLATWPLDMAMRYLAEKLPVVTKEDLDEARLAHIKRRDSGANTGTIVHELAEQRLLGKEIDLSGYDEGVHMAIGGFNKWLSGSKPEVIAVEQMVYSETLDYTGTFDSILKIDGKTYLCDLKTTNASKDAPEGVYNEYFVQLGAYAEAYEEQRQYEQDNGGTELVEIDDVMIISCKKNGKVHTKTGSDVGFTVENCRQLWRSVWHLNGELTKIKNILGGK